MSRYMTFVLFIHISIASQSIVNFNNDILTLVNNPLSGKCDYELGTLVLLNKSELRT